MRRRRHRGIGWIDPRDESAKTAPGFENPADSNSRYARATVLTARLICPASSRTVGNRVPGGNLPSRIPSMICVLSWSKSGLAAC